MGSKGTFRVSLRLSTYHTVPWVLRWSTGRGRHPLFVFLLTLIFIVLRVVYTVGTTEDRCISYPDLPSLSFCPRTRLSVEGGFVVGWTEGVDLISVNTPSRSPPHEKSELP